VLADAVRIDGTSSTTPLKSTGMSEGTARNDVAYAVPVLEGPRETRKQRRANEGLHTSREALDQNALRHSLEVRVVAEFEAQRAVRMAHEVEDLRKKEGGDAMVARIAEKI
jgi:hypothetical protein